MGQHAQCSHCGKPLVVVIETDDEALLARLDRMEKTLGRVLRLLTKLGGKIMDEIHADIAEAFGPVLDAVSQVSTDTAKALADLALQLAPRLTDEEKAQFAGVAQSLLDLDATVKAADPGDGSTPPVEPAPAEGTGE